MNNEISKDQKVLILRSGIQIYVDKSKADILLDMLSKPSKAKIIRYEGEIINTVDIVGLFEPKTIEHWTQKQNGNWQCRYNQWHSRGEKCSDLCVIKSVTQNTTSSVKNLAETLRQYKENICEKLENQKALSLEEKGLNEEKQVKLDYAVLRRLLPSGHPDIHNEIDVGGKLETVIRLQNKLLEKGIKTKVYWYSLRYKAYVEACKELMVSIDLQ